MRTASMILTFLSLACAAFAAWGLGTAAGRSQFDEMAGILPLLSAGGSVLLALCALFAWWRHVANRRKARVEDGPA